MKKIFLHNGAHRKSSVQKVWST